MNRQDQEYIKGFNSGYFLSKYEPGLMNKISNNLPLTTNYIEGLISGKEEFELELSRGHQNELENLRNSKERNQDLER